MFGIFRFRYEFVFTVARAIYPWFADSRSGFAQNVPDLSISATISCQYRWLGFIYPLPLSKQYFFKILYWWTTLGNDFVTTLLLRLVFIRVRSYCRYLSLSLVLFGTNVDALSVSCSISFQASLLLVTGRILNECPWFTCFLHDSVPKVAVFDCWYKSYQCCYRL